MFCRGANFIAAWRAPLVLTDSRLPSGRSRTFFAIRVIAAATTIISSSIRSFATVAAKPYANPLEDYTMAWLVSAFD
jgi:hypothetical protein